MNKPGVSEQQIIARIERLPVSRWYARTLVAAEQAWQAPLQAPLRALPS